MQLPTITFGKDAEGNAWDAPRNHQVRAYGKEQIIILINDGFKFLHRNSATIRDRAASRTGRSNPFYDSLQYLFTAMDDGKPNWNLVVKKGIHQFSKWNCPYPPHITVSSRWGTAHLWLSNGVFALHPNEGVFPMPKTDQGPNFPYQVAQISLKEEGPFFPQTVRAGVWSNKKVVPMVLPIEPINKAPAGK